MTGSTPDWGAQLRGLAEVATGLLGGPGAEPRGPGPSDDHAAECRSCPVCAALAVLRGRRPDVSEALADLLATAAATLRSHAEGQRTHAEGQRPHAEGQRPQAEGQRHHPDDQRTHAEGRRRSSQPGPVVPAPADEQAPPAPPVQHIEVA